MRRLQSTRILLLGAFVAFIGLAPGGASASSIGVYFAPDATDCDAYQPAFAPLYWYVLAVLNGADGAENGIAGAAFRITGPPASWFHQPTPSPMAFVASPGNPLAEGVELGFAVCQTGTAGVVLLYTILSFSTSQINGLVYAVHPPLLPSYAGYDHPVLVACDGPAFTRICVIGTPGYVNGSVQCGGDAPTAGIECSPVGVEPHTWAGLKKLYGD